MGTYTWGRILLFYSSKGCLQGTMSFGINVQDDQHEAQDEANGIPV